MLTIGRILISQSYPLWTFLLSSEILTEVYRIGSLQSPRASLLSWSVNGLLVKIIPAPVTDVAKRVSISALVRDVDISIHPRTVSALARRKSIGLTLYRMHA
jgi:hypothetical protein